DRQRAEAAVSEPAGEVDPLAVVAEELMSEHHTPRALADLEAVDVGAVRRLEMHRDVARLRAVIPVLSACRPRHDEERNKPAHPDGRPHRSSSSIAASAPSTAARARAMP